MVETEEQQVVVVPTCLDFCVSKSNVSSVQFPMLDAEIFVLVMLLFANESRDGT